MCEVCVLRCRTLRRRENLACRTAWWNAVGAAPRARAPALSCSACRSCSACFNFLTRSSRSTAASCEKASSSSSLAHMQNSSSAASARLVASLRSAASEVRRWLAWLSSASARSARCWAAKLSRSLCALHGHGQCLSGPFTLHASALLLCNFCALQCGCFAFILHFCGCAPLLPSSEKRATFRREIAARTQTVAETLAALFCSGGPGSAFVLRAPLRLIPIQFSMSSYGSTKVRRNCQ
jgi:hypothetical protein